MDGTQATTPNYCYGHQNQIQSSSLQGGSTNPSEQNFDGMPQSYGFSNLNCQSIFLADGTERSYFTLPADYPLEQATPPVSPSAADNVGVTAQLSGAAQAAGLAPGLCSNDDVVAVSDMTLVHNLQVPLTVQDTPNVCKKMPVYDIYVEEDSACLNIISDVRDFTLGLQQQEDERVCSCPVTKASDSSATKSSQLSIEHSMRELRLLWDPGASAFLATPLNIDSNNNTSGNEHVGLLVSSTGVFNEIMLDIPPAKPPERYGNADSSLHGIAIPSYMYIWPQMRAVKTLTWSQNQLFSNLQYQLQMSKTLSFWDPGILSLMDMMLGKNAVPNLVYSGRDQTPCRLLNFIGRPVDLKQFWAQLLLQSRFWYNIPTVCLQVQSYCLQIVLACPIFGSVQQLVCYSSMFSSTQAILSAICLSTATTLCMMLVLSSGNIARDKDVAALYQIFKVQLQMSKASRIWNPGVKISLYSWLNILTVWSATDKQLSCTHIPDLAAWPNQSVGHSASIMDPGTMLLQYKFLYTEENTNCHKNIKCYGVALWLIHFQPP